MASVTGGIRNLLDVPARVSFKRLSQAFMRRARGKKAALRPSAGSMQNRLLATELRKDH
jgi:hypothetical protein